MNIIGRVTTNLNEYMFERWPSTFVEVPKKGSFMKSFSGAILEVKRITHCCELNEEHNQVPFVEIEIS